MRILLSFLLVLLFTNSQSLELVFPGILIPPETILQARKAHQYLAYNLQHLSHHKMSKYNLYLAVQNYKEILDHIKIIVLTTIGNYVIGSRNIVLGKGNIVLGSNNKLAGNDNWILTEKEVTSTSIETNILYFKRWRIKLDLIPYIEYHPELVIQNMDPEDCQLLYKVRSARDIHKFHERKARRNRQHRKD